VNIQTVKALAKPAAIAIGMLSFVILKAKVFITLYPRMRPPKAMKNEE